MLCNLIYEIGFVVEDERFIILVMVDLVIQFEGDCFLLDFAVLGVVMAEHVQIYADRTKKKPV